MRFARCRGPSPFHRLRGNVPTVSKTRYYTAPSSIIEKDEKKSLSLNDSKESNGEKRLHSPQKFLDLVNNHDHQAAWQEFDQMISTDTLSIKDCTTAMKLCYTSAEMRQMMDDVFPVLQSSLKASLHKKSDYRNFLRVAYHMLISQLLVECDLDGANKVLEEMRRKRLQSGLTKHIFERSQSDLQRMRQARLRQLLLVKGRGEAVETANRLFHKFLGCGIVDTPMVNLMLNKYCKTSDEQLELLQECIPSWRENGGIGTDIRADEQTFFEVAWQMDKEGNIRGAFDVLQTYAKLKIDKKPRLKTRKLRDQLLQKKKEMEGRIKTEMNIVNSGRAKRLVEMLQKSRTRDAWRYFYSLIDDATVDRASCLVMLKQCSNSNDANDFVEGLMPRIGLVPGVNEYVYLALREGIEGRHDTARKILEKKITLPSLKAVSNLNYINTLLDEEDYRKEQRIMDITNERKTLLNTFFLQNDHKSAWSLFEKLIEADEVTLDTCENMMRFCNTADDMTRLLTEVMPVLGVAPNEDMYLSYANQLCVEGDKNEATKFLEKMIPTPVTDDAKNQKNMILTTPQNANAFKKQLTSQLARHVENGSMERVGAAWSLYTKALNSGFADLGHTSVVMKLCTSSDDMRVLIGLALENRKNDNSDDDKSNQFGKDVLYSQLLNRIMIEGDYDAAKRLVEDEMPKIGANLTKRGKDVFENGIHTRKLELERRLLLNLCISHDGGDLDRALSLLSLFRERSIANSFHVRFMMDEIMKQKDWSFEKDPTPLTLFRQSLNEEDEGEEGKKRVKKRNISIDQYRVNYANLQKNKTLHINMHATTKAVCHVKAIDVLLTIRSMMNELDRDNVKLCFDVGRGNNSGIKLKEGANFKSTKPVLKETVVDLFTNILHPPVDIEIVKDALIYVKGDQLWNWFNSKQAEEWKTAAGAK
eukprot:g436.t1